MKQAEELREQAKRLEREVKRDQAAAILAVLVNLESAVGQISDWDLTDKYEEFVGMVRFHTGDEKVAMDRAVLLRALFPGALNIDAAAELITYPEPEERPWE